MLKDYTPFEAPREEFSPAPSQLLETPNRPFNSLACSCIIPISAYIFRSPSLCVCPFCHIEFRVHARVTPFQVLLYLYLQRPTSKQGPLLRFQPGWIWGMHYYTTASQVVIVVKNPPANAGGIRHMLTPGLGRSPGEGHGNPLQYSCLESSWTEKAGRLQSMGLQRGEHDWSNFYTLLHYCVEICK